MCEPWSKESVASLLLNTHINITVDVCYYILYLLSVFSLVKSLQLILEISATYRLVSYLLGDN